MNEAIDKIILYVCTDPNDYKTFENVIRKLDKNIKIIIFDGRPELTSVPYNSNNYKVINIKDIGYDFKYFLFYLSPKILIFANDTSIISRVFILAANKLKIPTLLIPHGVQGKIPRSKIGVLKTWRVFFKNKEEFYRNIRIVLNKEALFHILNAAIFTLKTGYNMGHSGCKKIYCIGEEQKDYLIKQGVPENNMVVTGSPRFDNIKEKLKRDVPNELLSLLKGKKLILVLTEARIEQELWSVKKHSIWIKTVLDGICSYKDLVPIVKLHPQEDKKFHRDILNKLGFNNVYLFKNEFDLYDFIKLSTACISLTSTAYIEAMCFEKPVIIVRLFNEPDSRGLTKARVVLDISSKKELIKALDIILKDEDYIDQLKGKQADYLRRIINYGENATENVINQIHKIL